jgi:hypothetical protein
MVGDAQLQANDRGDPTTGPHVSSKPVGGRATLEEWGQAGELLACHAACSAGRRVMPEGIGPLVAGTAHPLTDGPFADAERLGNPPLSPPVLLEGPGLQPSGFFPSCRCTVHAWQWTITTEKL